MNFRLRTSTTSSSGDSTDLANPLSTSGIEHLIVTYDQAEIQFYRGGSVDQTETLSGSFSSWDSSFKLVLANIADDDRPWHGKLYRLAIYDKPLTQSQVDDVMAGDPPGEGSGSGFVARWVERP